MSDSSSPGADSSAGVFSLTQIRHLMRVEFGRAQRYGYPLSCLVLSCDRLDHLRDLYGYEFREAVLDDVVRVLQKTFRACDYLGRLMDDRLMTILPHTTREGAEVSAQRILAAARELEFRSGGTGIQVTVSIGISHFENENTIFFDSLVEAAESALRQASKAGGDRLVYASPGPAQKV